MEFELAEANTVIQVMQAIQKFFDLPPLRITVHVLLNEGGGSFPLLNIDDYRN